MSTKSKISKSMTTAIGFAFVSSSVFSQLTPASGNPFAFADLDSGYMLADSEDRDKDGKDREGKGDEGKCGEGKCSDSPGTDTESKGDEGKCGEGKCGSDTTEKQKNAKNGDEG